MGNDEKIEKKKSCNRFKIWVTNIRENWIIYIFKTISYVLPVIVVNDKILSFISNYFYIYFGTILFVFIVSEILTSLHSENIQRIKNEKVELKDKYSKLEEYAETIGFLVEGLPNEFLIRISMFLKLKNSDRISLYVLSDNEFRIIGRFSENPKYNRMGRKQYPIDKGYISKCLENDNGDQFFYINNLPKKDEAYLKKVSKETGMTFEEIKKLSMISRCYFTKVIKDLNNKNVGILVLESMNPYLEFEPKKLDEELNKLIAPLMTIFVNTSNRLKGEVSDGK